MLTGQDLINCQTRIAQRLENGESIGVWDIVRNNENVASRKHVRMLDANAPVHSASMKAWRSYVAAITRKRHQRKLLNGKLFINLCLFK